MLTEPLMHQELLDDLSAVVWLQEKKDIHTFYITSGATWFKLDHRSEGRGIQHGGIEKKEEGDFTARFFEG